MSKTTFREGGYKFKQEYIRGRAESLNIYTSRTVHNQSLMPIQASFKAPSAIEQWMLHLPPQTRFVCMDTCYYYLYAIPLLSCRNCVDLKVQRPRMQLTRGPSTCWCAYTRGRRSGWARRATDRSSHPWILALLTRMRHGAWGIEGAWGARPAGYETHPLR